MSLDAFQGSADRACASHNSTPPDLGPKQSAGSDAIWMQRVIFSLCAGPRVVAQRFRLLTPGTEELQFPVVRDQSRFWRRGAAYPSRLSQDRLDVSATGDGQRKVSGK